VNVFEFGELIFTHPSNRNEEISFFGLSVAYNAPEQLINKWTRVGQRGQQIKTLGTNGSSGTVVGFLDAATQESLSAAMSAIQEEVDLAIPKHTAICGLTVSETGLITTVTWTKIWGHSTINQRYCASFVLAWEAP